MKSVQDRWVFADGVKELADCFRIIARERGEVVERALLNVVERFGGSSSDCLTASGAERLAALKDDAALRAVVGTDVLVVVAGDDALALKDTVDHLLVVELSVDVEHVARTPVVLEHDMLVVVVGVELGARGGSVPEGPEDALNLKAGVLSGVADDVVDTGMTEGVALAVVAELVPEGCVWLLRSGVCGEPVSEVRLCDGDRFLARRPLQTFGVLVPRDDSVVATDFDVADAQTTDGTGARTEVPEHGDDCLVARMVSGIEHVVELLFGVDVVRSDSLSALNVGLRKLGPPVLAEDGADERGEDSDVLVAGSSGEVFLSGVGLEEALGSVAVELRHRFVGMDGEEFERREVGDTRTDSVVLVGEVFVEGDERLTVDVCDIVVSADSLHELIMLAVLPFDVVDVGHRPTLDSEYFKIIVAGTSTICEDYTEVVANQGGASA